MSIVRRVVVAVVVVVQTCLWCSALLGWIAFQRLKKGAEVLTPRQRKRPAILDDPKYGTHHTATVKGINIHYVEKGDKSRPLLLLIHGFPAFWYSWHFQMEDLSKDYWVIAVDMRGYGESSKPAGKHNYTKQKVAEDLFELVISLGRQSCVVAAHDWGGLIAYQLAESRPSLVQKLIILNAPHHYDMAELLQTPFDQVFRSWYIFMFQLPWLAETLFSLDDMALFKKMFHANPALVKFYPPELIEAFKYTFQAPGALTPPVNYYRENLNVSPVLFGTELPPAARIVCPLLVIWGENDHALSSLLATMPARHADRFRVRFIEDVSHWVMMEAPDQVNQYIREFVEEEN